MVVSLTGRKYRGPNMQNILIRTEEGRRIREAFTCRARREGDEIACSCGKRWPVGEQHP